MGILLLLIVLVVIVLSIPAVQTKIATKITDGLNETYGTNIYIKRLGLNWKGQVDIREVYIQDHREDTLIYSEELKTSILSIKKLVDGDLNFGYVDFKNMKFHLKTYKGEVDDNVTVFADKFSTGDTTSTKPFILLSDKVTIENGKISITDENLETPQIFRFSDLQLNGGDFSINGPDVAAHINRLSLSAERGFMIEALEGDFSYGLEHLAIKNMNLSTESSLLKGDLLLSYTEENGLADFENQVTIDLSLDDSMIATNDINAFYDEFGSNLLIDIEGDLKGTLNDFSFKRGRLSTKGTFVSGDFRFQGLLNDGDDYVISSSNHNFSTSYYELRRLMPRVIGEELPNELKDFGNFKLKGNSTLAGDNLTTKGTVHSALGFVETDLELGNIGNFDNAFYNGNLKFTEFNLGKVSGTASLGNITANLDLSGSGFTKETVNTRIIGTVSSFEFEGYQYQNISVSGNLKDPLFNGQLKIDDPNLKMDFAGLLDASKDFNQYDFTTNIEYAELNKLNLIKRDSISVFAGQIIMDMDGTTINDAVGTIEFVESFYQTENDDFYFDDFLITSTFEEDLRTIDIKSPDIIDGKITGRFLVEDIPNLFRNAVGSIYANYIPNEVTTNQFIDYEFEVFNKIIDVFIPDLQLGENTKVKGSVYSDESKFKLNFKSPELLLYKNYLGKVNIQVDNDNPLFNTFVSVDSLYTGVYNVSDLSFINKTLNDTLYIQSEFKGGAKQADLFNMSLYHTINPLGKSVVGIKKSDINYNDNTWYINENNDNLNKLTFDDNFSNVRLDSLILSHNGERIEMNGLIQDTDYKDIKMRFKDVELGNIIPKLDDVSLMGNINGSLDFLQKDGANYPNSTVTIDKLIVNKILFGDLNLQVEGNEDLTRYDINTTLVRGDVKSLNAQGNIDVKGENPEIQMNVDLTDFNLAAISPLGGDNVTDIRGLISGRARVSGNYKSPDVVGRLSLDEGGLKIPELNTDFDIDNGTTVYVTKDAFSITASKITDTKYNTFGEVAGSITHQNFTEWGLNLNLTADRILVLDTPPTEDALYYGTAFISGEADLSGPFEEMVIDVTAATEEGTTFKIPISDAESIGDDSFIHFLSPEEKQAKISGETIVAEELKGLSLNFDLDINDKAEVEVVVDQVNNTTLKGRGDGLLLIRLNTLGKFNMWGEFTVIEGYFDFRYGGIIQKQFEVVGGGNILWDGSPTRARLNLSALYKTEANPSVLLDNPTVNRKIPVSVLVDLSGEILQPDLNFRVEFPEVSSIVRSELEYKLQDEEQREKQALFLVSTGSFVSDASAGQNAIAGTLAERVNALVAEIFSDSDSKFNVLPYFNPGSRTVDQETADQLGFQLSTQISERIIINGKVGIPVGGVNESTVAGDVQIQWLVNEDGTLRVNFFNRQAQLQFIGEDQIFEQGAGVSYSVDFDTFKELVDKLFGTDIILDPENELPVVPDDQDAPVNFTSKKGIKNDDD